MTTSGISTRLINLASALVGFIRGGLAMVTIVASMFFGEISGSAVAGAAAIGQVVIHTSRALVAIRPRRPSRSVNWAEH